MADMSADMSASDMSADISGQQLTCFLNMLPTCWLTCRPTCCWHKICLSFWPSGQHANIRHSQLRFEENNLPHMNGCTSKGEELLGQIKMGVCNKCEHEKECQSLMVRGRSNIMKCNTAAEITIYLMLEVSEVGDLDYLFAIHLLFTSSKVLWAW